MRPIVSLLGVLILAGCTGPMSDLSGADKTSGLAEPVVEEAPIAAAPVAPAEICDDPGDGIGGTGCAVE
ncbi:MAG: hypothetical protein AB8B82_13745 [Roseovarius sp.]